MVTFNSNYLSFFFNILLYFNFLLNFNFFLTSKHSFKLIDGVYLLSKLPHNRSLFINNFKYSSKFLTLFPKSINSHKNFIHKIDSLIISRTLKFILLPKSKIFISLLTLFFIVSSSPKDNHFAVHSNFRLLNLIELNSTQLVFNPNKFFLKWHNIYLFLYNLFYYSLLPLIFSSIFFRKETLALNWNLHSFSMASFRYASILFIFKTLIFSKKFNDFFMKLSRLNFNCALLTDIQYHFRLLHYFYKFKWFLVAIIPSNINPWAVDVAFPVLYNNVFMQFFFFKLFLLIKKQVMYEKFLFYQKLWLNRRICFNFYS